MHFSLFLFVGPKSPNLGPILTIFAGPSPSTKTGPNDKANLAAASWPTRPTRATRHQDPTGPFLYFHASRMHRTTGHATFFSCRGPFSMLHAQAFLPRLLFRTNRELQGNPSCFISMHSGPMHNGLLCRPEDKTTTSKLFAIQAVLSHTSTAWPNDSTLQSPSPLPAARNSPSHDLPFSLCSTRSLRAC